MNLLVTGGCGFIGTNFVYHMLESRPDVAIVNLDKLTYAGNRNSLAPAEQRFGGSRYHFAHGDIADRDLVQDLIKRFEINAIVNFAAESHVDRSIDDPAPFVSTNIAGTQTLLEAARTLRVDRFIQISTDEVYGSLGPDGRFTETTPLSPNSPYSASKAAADLMVRAYHETYGLDTVVTRCSNNYGPFQFPEKLIPLMYINAREDRSLPVYGNGRNVRDWIYVQDHCRGVALAIEKGRSGAVYNFGGDEEKENLEVVQAVLNLLDKPASLIRFVKDRPGHDLRYAMDYTRAKQELGWRPVFSFDQGLKETVQWYRDNPDWLESVCSGSYRTFMARWYGERK